MSEAATPPSIGWIERRVTIAAEEGLHARPAIRLARLARQFAAVVQMRAENEEHWLNGKSVAKLMGLRAEQGAAVVLRASGVDAEAAVAALAGLIAGSFMQEGDGPG